MTKNIVKLVLSFMLVFGNHAMAKKEVSKALPMALEAIKIVLNPEFEKRPGLFDKGNRLGEMVSLLKKQNISPVYLKKILNKWESSEKSFDEDRFALREDNHGDEVLRVNELRSLGPVGSTGDFSDWSFDYSSSTPSETRNTNNVINENERREDPSLIGSSVDARPENNRTEKLKMPRMALHAYQMEVIEEKDDFLKDDIYFFFYTTDGATTTGRVSEIYKGLSAGQSFFLSAQDRVIFPTADLGYATPYRHLIVDFSIIESEGDDIKEMQKMSEAIIPLAAAAYGLYTGDMSTVLASTASVTLRKEVGKLSKSLIALNNDDRLVNESLTYTPRKLKNVFLDEDFFEFSKIYSGTTPMSTWKYKLNFRMFNDY
tara:strand:+ start:2832 stop:3950 length:1119 start_codon:yes stop_codon:yes gene_type:complete